MLPRLVSLNQSEKLAQKENLNLSLTVTSAPLLMFLHFLDNQKQKFRIHVTGYILIYRKLNAKLIIPLKKTSWLVLDNPINTTVRMTQK